MTGQGTTEGNVPTQGNRIDQRADRAVGHESTGIEDKRTETNWAIDESLASGRDFIVGRAGTQDNARPSDGQITVKGVGSGEVDGTCARQQEASRRTEGILDHAREHETRRGDPRSGNGPVRTCQFPRRGDGRNVERVVVDDGDGSGRAAESHGARTRDRDGGTSGQVRRLIQRERNNGVRTRAEGERTRAINRHRGSSPEGTRRRDVRTIHLVHVREIHGAAVDD